PSPLGRGTCLPLLNSRRFETFWGGDCGRTDSDDMSTPARPFAPHRLVGPACCRNPRPERAAKRLDRVPGDDLGGRSSGLWELGHIEGRNMAIKRDTTRYLDGNEESYAALTFQDRQPSIPLGSRLTLAHGQDFTSCTTKDSNFSWRPPWFTPHPCV